MNEYFKRNFDELFSEKSQPDYCVLLVEHRTQTGEMSPSETLSSVYNACKNLLIASYVNHYAEIYDGFVFCYLNYDERSFSTRAFVGSLRQIIHTLTPDSRSTVYYSSAVKTKKELINEDHFLHNASKYSPILGFSQPYRGAYLHSCEDSRSELDHSVLYTLSELLSARKYDEAVDILNKASDFMSNIYQNDYIYSCSECLRYVTDIWYAVKIYFCSQHFKQDFFEKSLISLLYSFNGSGRFLNRLSEITVEYQNTFIPVSSTAREQNLTDEIIAHINKNLSSTNLNETAAYFDMSPEYLCRLFKKNLGENFSEYIKKKRFERALELLSGDEKISIAKITTMLGYKSQSHFQNIFKQEYGISPDAYRKAMVKERLSN